MKASYKQSALGLIPEDWEVRRLENISEIQQGISKGKMIAQSNALTVPYMRVANVKDGEIDLTEVKDIEIDKNNLNKYTLMLEDILITEGGDPDKLGRGGMWNGEIANCVFQNHLFRIRVNKKILLPYFLYNYFQGHSAKTYFLSCAKQTTGIASINSSQVKATPIPVPPIAEQKKSAAVIFSWDTAISTATKLIAQKERRKKWLMQCLLTGKKRLNGFNGEWKEYNYDQLFKIVKRPVQWDDDERYNLISVRRRSGGIFLREALYGHQIKVKDLRTALTGDFLFSKMQILHGASALVAQQFDNAKISGSYIAVVAKDPNVLNIEYFNWFSQSRFFYHQTYISSYGVHIEKMTFDFEAFLGLGMKLPSVDEQTAIANVLQTADSEINLLREKLAGLIEQKKGLIQLLLTGKKRMKF